MSIMNNISNLPYEIIELIKQFIPYKKFVFTNTTYYNLYHYTLKEYIPLYDNYIRDMIRRDNEFVFDKILCENIDKWLTNKQFAYKNMIFNNYIYFVMHFCIENNSDRCRDVIIQYLSKRDLCKNLHKKNVVKYIKWKN